MLFASTVSGFKPPGRLDPKWVLLCILLALAIFTRFWQLDALPYGHNNDEAAMTYEGYLLLQAKEFQIFVSQARESTLPYLYGYLVEHFGYSNGIVRMPSAVSGVVGCLCLCLLIFRFMPDEWAFCVSLAAVSYGPYVALDRLALRTSVCTAVVFAFLLFFFNWRSSEQRLHWFLLGLIFGLGFHTYNAYRIMPLVVAVLFVVHFWDPRERARLGRKLLFFGGGSLATGWVFIYMLLAHRTEYVFFRETTMMQRMTFGEASVWGMLGRNLVDFGRMLAGGDVPLPLGASVPFFHFVWVPFLIVGAWSAVRSGVRRPQFAILITYVVFLVPVLLSDDLLARRYLTSLVLAVVLTGYGAYQTVRRLGWDRSRVARTAAVFLAVGVASWNLYSYFGSYASHPKSDQGPFFAPHRWFGPLLDELVTPETKILIAEEVPDPFMLELYLIEKLEISEESPAVLRLRREYDDLSTAHVESYCRTASPIVFLHMMDTPPEVVELVTRACGTTVTVPIDWPDGIVEGEFQPIIVATRPEH